MMTEAAFVGCASADIAERLTGSLAVTRLPHAFKSELELVEDRRLRLSDELIINAARLTSSALTPRSPRHTVQDARRNEGRTYDWSAT